MKPSISVIIPAYNEAHTINFTLKQLYSQDFSASFEVILVDGDPQRKTAAAVTDGRVKKIVSERGRAIQMNTGTRVASGDILLFLHADTVLPEHGLTMIQKACMAPKTAGGAFDLGIRSEDALFRLVEFGVRLRYRLTRIPYGDQAIFIRRSVFEGLGGYPEIPLMEDVALIRSLRASGKHLVQIRHKVSTSARRWQKEGILRCTLRNYILIILYHMGVSPFKLAHYYPLT